jgi:hypothetical protein
MNCASFLPSWEETKQQQLLKVTIFFVELSPPLQVQVLRMKAQVPRIDDSMITFAAMRTASASSNSSSSLGMLLLRIIVIATTFISSDAFGYTILFLELAPCTKTRYFLAKRFHAPKAYVFAFTRYVDIVKKKR